MQIQRQLQMKEFSREPLQSLSIFSLYRASH